MDIPNRFFETDLIYYSLSEEHNISNFCCSELELSKFLKEDALNNQTRNFSVTHLAYWNDTLVGYFTLVNDCISINNIDPGDRQEDLEYMKYPALKIARFATDLNFERKGIGSLMMDEVFFITFDISKRVGCRILTVDAKKSACKFYIKCGFKEALNKPKETIPMYMDFYSALIHE